MKKDIIKIIVANFFSQGFLFLLTGTFWDDWFYYYRDRASLWAEFLEAGRPSSAYWIEAVWNIPHYGYRWLVFFLFMFTSILLYLLIRNCDKFSANEALYLSILYTVIPINDARIILCTFSYSIGLTFFFVGCYIFSNYIKEEKLKKKNFLRIASLVFFGYSFIIQSILMYYAIILCYLLYFEYINTGKLLKAIYSMSKYFDFIILPIVFYIGKQWLFPAHGPRFTDYNSVTGGAVLKSALRLPIATFRQFQRIWITIFEFIAKAEIMQLLMVSMIIFAVARAGIWFCNIRSAKFHENVGGGYNI